MGEGFPNDMDVDDWLIELQHKCIRDQQKEIEMQNKCIRDQKREIDILKLQIHYMPGGQGEKDAHEHFNSLKIDIVAEPVIGDEK